MKKTFVLIAFLAACSFTSVMAQQQQNGDRRFDPAQRAAMFKERIKDLNLTPAQQDSAVAIYSERPAGGGANFREMSQEERQAAFQKINADRQARLVKAGLTEDQAKQVAEKLSFRPGGQRPPQPQGNQ